MNRARRGATAVEMAVVAPLFFLLALVLIEFGRIALVKQALTDAARAGCREATLATTLTQSEVESTIRDNLQAVIADSHANHCRFTVSHADFADLAPGTEITVGIEVDCSDVSWIAPRYGSEVVIKAGATMTRE